MVSNIRGYKVSFCWQWVSSMKGLIRERVSLSSEGPHKRGDCTLLKKPKHNCNIRNIHHLMWIMWIKCLKPAVKPDALGDKLGHLLIGQHGDTDRPLPFVVCLVDRILDLHVHVHCMLLCRGNYKRHEYFNGHHELLSTTTSTVPYSL